MINNIANRITELYETLGKSQLEFSKEIDFDQSTISQIESGRTKNPSRRLINAILAVYPQVNEAWLKRGEGKMLLDEAVLERKKGYSINYCRADPVCKKVCNACMSPHDPEIKEALCCVVDILQSGNETISAAIKMNIKAFYEASQDKKTLRSMRSPKGRSTKKKEK